MTKPCSETQQQWLRSTLVHALNNTPCPWLLTVETGLAKSPLWRIWQERNENRYLCESPQSRHTEHIDYEVLLDRLMQVLLQAKATLIIDQDGWQERIAFYNGKLQREREEKPPSAQSRSALANPLWAIGKTTHLDPEHSAPLLKAIGLMTESGEIKAPMRRKFKQVNHFLDLLSPILKTISQKPFTLVDCGCGQNYLGFTLFWYLRRVLGCQAEFVGVDVTEKLLQRCRRRAEQLTLSGMRFLCSSVMEADLPDSIDLLVSLHACDTATDEALGQGIARGAQHIVAVPCCQHEIAKQLDGAPHYPLKKHGIFTQRFGDLLTDMARALYLEANGYTVTAGEFVSAEETPKNLMLRASRGNPRQRQRLDEYHEFCRHYGISPSIEWITQSLEAQSIWP